MFFTPFMMKKRFTIAILILLGVPFSGGVPAKQTSSKTAQINQMVSTFATQPVKVTATTPAPVTVGAKSQIQIGLLNADNQPVSATEDWQYVVSVTPPSGTLTSQTVWIKKGQSVAQVDFAPQQAGLASISVRPLTPGVRSYNTEIVVRPLSKPLKFKKLKGPQGSLSLPTIGDAAHVLWAADSSRAQYRTVAFASAPSAATAEAEPQNGGEPVKQLPVLYILVDNKADARYANGKDAAVISAIYNSPDNSPAPADINLFFHLTTGALVPPQPLRIAKGSYKAEAQLTSTYAADVEVTLVSPPPAYQSQGDTDFTIHFIPPLFRLNVPDTLTVVDSPTATVEFLDEHGNEMSPTKNYQVSLFSEQSKLQFTPKSFQPPMDHAVLIPVSVGNDTIDADVTYYPKQKLSIVITGWLVLGLCLVGGAAGGLAAYDKFKGSWSWRIFLGVLGGAVLCWIYVYVALPNVTFNIAHNTISVFFVALIGGYSGTATLDFAAKKLGLAT